MISVADIKDRVWAQVEPTVYVGRDEFFEGWTIDGVEINGELVAAVLTRGPEIHYASLGTGRPLTLKMFRRHLQPIIDAHGYATTRTPKDDLRQARFNELIGFKAAAEDEFFVHYRIEKVAHAGH